MRGTITGKRGCVVSVASVMLFGVSACDGGDEDQRSERDAEVAEQMSSDFAEQGNETLAERLDDGDATELAQIETPYLHDWEFFDVSTDTESGHPPIVTSVATGGAGSELLTGNPEGFETVLSSDSGRIEDADTATRVVDDYIMLTATRADDAFTIVLDSTDDIEVWSGYEDELAEVDEEFGDEIEPPRAEQSGDEYIVTAYVQHNFEIQLRTVTVGPNGSIDDDSETLVEDVHAP